MLEGQIECGRFIAEELEDAWGGNNTPSPPPNLWNLIIHSQPLDFSSARSVHILTSYFFEINFNNILLFNNLNWSLIFRYCGYIFKRTSHLARMVTYPSSFQVDTVHPFVFIYVYGVIQEESPIFLEEVSVTVRKKIFMWTCI
jgi:hypothetical protein